MTAVPRLSPRPVTAYSIANALGSRTLTVVDALMAGRSGIEPHPEAPPWDGAVGVVTEWLELPQAMLAWDTRQARLAYTAYAEIAAGVARAVERWGGPRVGLVLGSSTGGMAATEAAYRERLKTGALPPDFSLERHHAFHAFAEMLGGLSGARGPNYVISTACSSSGKAFASAMRLIDGGDCDAVVVGGVDTRCDLALRGFHSLAILSSSGCRPFGQQRGGINIGEGGAFALIERDLAPGDRACGWLLGVGESCDGHHMTAPRPDGLGAEEAMRAALAQGGVASEQVQYVNAHGTGTLLNDAAEAQAIVRALGSNVAVSSTKRYFGHLLGAAGGAEAIVCLAALERQRVPVNLCDTPVDETLSLNVVVGARAGDSASEAPDTAAPPLEVTYALSNSFAFGGSNVGVLFGRAPTKAPVLETYEVDVVDVALWAAGFPSWEAFERGKPDPSAQVPACTLLGVRDRGRASVATRLSIELLGALTAGGTTVDLSKVPTVFASCYGEMQTTVDLLQMLNEGDGSVSPARFRASVHNTASGVFTIAKENRAFSTSIAAGYDTVAMALLDARAWVRVHGGTCLVVMGDEASQAILSPNDAHGALGVGVRLVGRAKGQPRAGGALATIGGFRRTQDVCRLGVGEALSGNPCAPGVALLRALVSGARGWMTLRHPRADASGWAVDLR